LTFGADSPGETFRVLKEKEIKQFAEYRTRRLVLEAWDTMEGSTKDRGILSEQKIKELMRYRD
jgi:hypothetical protein